MFFKALLNGISESLEVKHKSSMRTGINPADMGELCEIFVKEFLSDCLDDQYKVYRGGNIVNINGDLSPQIDIILANKNTLKIFGEKGLYPIETVIGVFSITSNLTLPKLKDSIAQLGKIPKHHYCFHMEMFYGEKFIKETDSVWKNTVPFSCIFGFKGEIKESWATEIQSEVSKIADKSLWPSLIVVNKKLMFEKCIKKNSDGALDYWYECVKIDTDEKHGYYLSKILFHLYNLSGEQQFRRPDYAKYFEKDY